MAKQTRDEKARRIRELAEEARDFNRRYDKRCEESAAEGRRLREAGERYRREKSEYERTMEARDKTAKRVADHSGMSFTDAQKLVVDSMTKMRGRRGN